MQMHLVPRFIAVKAVEKLAAVDYSVATRVSDHASSIVKWAYAHDQWWIVQPTIHLVQQFDHLGSVLISFVVWLVMNAS